VTLNTFQDNAFEEAEASFRSQIKILEEEVERQKTMMRERMRLYAQEQELLLSLIHARGMKTVRQHLGSASQLKPTPTAWLPMQRNTVSSVDRMRIAMS
jgi:protein HOOK3